LEHDNKKIHYFLEPLLVFFTNGTTRCSVQPSRGYTDCLRMLSANTEVDTVENITIDPSLKIII
jgi:hypothetical protein